MITQVTDPYKVTQVYVREWYAFYSRRIVKSPAPNYLTNFAHQKKKKKTVLVETDEGVLFVIATP